MTPEPKEGATRMCRGCGKPLVRKTYRTGTLESGQNWRKRQFCDRFCAGRVMWIENTTSRAARVKRVQKISARGQRLCCVRDCTHSHKAHGFCRMHYQRWQKTGNPLVSARARFGSGFRYRDELEALTAEQDQEIRFGSRDMRGRTGHSVGTLPFALIAGGDGGHRAEFVYFDREEDRWPYYAARSSHLRRAS